MYTLPLKENKNCYATPGQRTILMELAKSKILADDFFLTGGTALSVFYLNHRISNDLDLFSIIPLDLSEINFQLKRMWPHQTTVIKESAYFLSSLIQNVKVDFVIDPLSQIHEREKYFFENGEVIRLDTLSNINSKKFGTIVGRNEPKDFIDFFFLNQPFSSNDLEPIFRAALKKDAIFEDPPTVAYQMEETIHFLQENSSLFPPLLLKFDENDFYQFYQQVIEWLYRKVLQPG